jgi:hypothetical protein
MVMEHEVALRAPRFLGGGPTPVVIRRTDQRFVQGLLRDLESEAGRKHIASQALPQAGESDAVLYLPVHRCFSLVLAEAYCDGPGEPRLDPESLDGVGVVIRRRRAERQGKKKTGKLLASERWVAEHARTLGWVQPQLTDGTSAPALDEDPLAAQRPALRSGSAEIDQALAKRREFALSTVDGPYDESFTELYVAPPRVCAALGSTLLFGLVDVADAAVAEAPRPRLGSSGAERKTGNGGYTSAEVEALLPIWLRARSTAPSIPSELRGQRFRVHDRGSLHMVDLTVQRREGDSWVDFKFSDPWRSEPGGNGSDLRHFLRLLWQLRIELQMFADKPSSKGLFATLDALPLTLPSAASSTLARTLEQASNVFVMLEEGSEVEFPGSWPLLAAATATQIIEGARSSLAGQLERFVRSEGRFDEDGSRYELRAFARVRREDGCPSTLVWSGATQPFRVAKWFDGGPDDALLPTIELPTLNRGFLKALRPNVAIRVPRSMFNFLNNNKPEDLLAGNAKNDTRGPAIAWICGFNVSIIFIIAFMLLITFVFMLNIAFWWMAFFRICIPLPVSRSGDD